MRKTSLGQASSTRACSSCRCRRRLALDPDIKGLRESFPPFKASALEPAPNALIFATSLPTMSTNYTLFKYLSPLVSQFFRTVDSPTLPAVPVSSLLALFYILLLDVARLPWSCPGVSHPKQGWLGTNWQAEQLFHNIMRMNFYPFNFLMP